MDLHRVRRLATVLVTSQLRSGRSGSDPKSVFARPSIIALADAGLFLFAFGVGLLAVDSSRGPSAPAGTWATVQAVYTSIVPFLPLVGVGVVLVAGMMFELTTTTRFSGSDAANWLPLGPSDYVLASTAAVAYTYSPAVALLLGALAPIAIAAGSVGPYLLSAALSALALVEGGLLIEMVRAATQRAGSVTVGRGGKVTLVLRAVVLLVVILTLQLVFNPVIIFGFVERLRDAAVVTSLVPFLWGTQAVLEAETGSALYAGTFLVLDLAFVALLLFVASRLRVRYWVPTASEIRIAGVEFGRGHPWLAAVGLAPAEAAVASKDLRGLVRRREMLPSLVLPVVLVVLIVIEGRSIGALAGIIWLGWVAGFFSLFLATTCVGQERRALQLLLATPIGPRGLLRAKAAGVLIPTSVGSALMAAAVGAYFRLGPGAYVGLLALSVTAAAVLGLWGLVFATRYSDFQDRPRPQFLRPAAMLAATGSGMTILFAIVIPGAVAILGGDDPIAFLLVAAAVALVFLGLAAHWARTGFDRLFRELPF
jgi:hypothetical protein